MKLYLTSYRIPDPQALCDFVGLKPNEVSIALIFNAHDVKTKEARQERYKDVTDNFTRLGLTWFEVNLAEYKNQPEALKSELLKSNLIWANGGNTYYLRYIMAESGFDSIIKSVLDEGVVYGGDSAGAIVAGPTLKYFESADDPKEAPEIVYGGLGLTELVVIPHWGNEKFQGILDGVAEKYKGTSYKTVTLSDDQALFIENDTWFVK